MVMMKTYAGSVLPLAAIAEQRIINTGHGTPTKDSYMRILHLGDLHIGKLFFNIHLTDDQAFVLDQVVEIARDQQVDVVAICGDVYDRSVPPVLATQLLDDFLSRLVLGLGKQVVMIPGNHDSPERLSFGSRMVRERGLLIASDIGGGIQPLILDDSHGPVQFFPIPYVEPLTLRRSLDDSEVIDFDSAYRLLLSRLDAIGPRSVCLAHCFTSGGHESESERPLTIGGSCHLNGKLFSPFALTLLGHLHRPQQVSPTAWYAGSPLKYSFSEIGHAKQVAIFDLDKTGQVTRTAIPLVPRRELRRLDGSLSGILAAAADDVCRDDYLWVNLTDRGALFDYAARLRDCYPNLVSITRAEFEGSEGGLSVELKRLGEREILASFLKHVTGEDPDEDESEVLEDVLRELSGGAP